MNLDNPRSKKGLAGLFGPGPLPKYDQDNPALDTWRTDPDGTRTKVQAGVKPDRGHALTPGEEYYGPDGKLIASNKQAKQFAPSYGLMPGLDGQPTYGVKVPGAPAYVPSNVNFDRTQQARFYGTLQQVAAGVPGLHVGAPSRGYKEQLGYWNAAVAKYGEKMAHQYAADPRGGDWPHKDGSAVDLQGPPAALKAGAERFRSKGFKVIDHYDDGHIHVEWVGGAMPAPKAPVTQGPKPPKPIFKTLREGGQNVVKQSDDNGKTWTQTGVAPNQPKDSTLDAIRNGTFSTPAADPVGEAIKAAAEAIASKNKKATP